MMAIRNMNMSNKFLLQDSINVVSHKGYIGVETSICNLSKVGNVDLRRTPVLQKNEYNR